MQAVHVAAINSGVESVDTRFREGSRRKYVTPTNIHKRDCVIELSERSNTG
jgi:hypothetical protein